MMRPGSAARSVQRRAWVSNSSFGSRIDTQRNGTTGRPLLYQRALSQTNSTTRCVPPYQLLTVMGIRAVFGSLATTERLGRREPALPHLKREGRSALIHISSVEAKRSFPFHSAYAASKHAIDGFLEALRVELRHEGWPISVTQVMPGTINTPFFDKGRTKLGVKPVGVPPIYEPQTVANIILYAAENPARDLVSGGAAQALILNQRLSPRMLDAILTTRGFQPPEDRGAEIRG